MKRLLSGVAVVVALTLIAVPGAQAVRVKVHGRIYGVMPTAGANLSSAIAAARAPASAGRSPLATPFVTAPAGWNVDYQGGPVLHTTRPYAIYWDPSGTGISSSSRGVINQYLTDVAAASDETSDVYGVGRQYYDSVGYADAGMTFSASSQGLVDTDPYPTTNNCPAESGYTNCITDAQLQSELSSFIAANHLPTDGPGTESQLPAGAPVYFLILPATVNTCLDQGGGSYDCSGGPAPDFGYCAYHDYYTDPNGNLVLYSNVPFSVFTEDPIKGCQSDSTSSTVLQAPNGDEADNIVDDLSHELNEAITDPTIGAWVNQSGDGNELADQCESYNSSSDPTQGYSVDAYIPLGGSASPSPTFGTLYDQLINGHEYYTQSMWSNGQVDCEMRPTSATLTPSFAIAGQTPVGQSVTADPTGTSSAAGVASATWSWGDGSTSFVPGALSTSAHSFSAAGQYTVKLTVVDVNGNLASATHQVDVGSNPTAVIGSLPASVPVGASVSFSGAGSSDPNAGATAGYGWSFGDGGSASGAAATHSFARTGTYTVTLTVSDAYGFSASRTATVTVVQLGRIMKVRSTHTRTSAYLFLTASQAGSVSYGGATHSVAPNGRAKFKLKLNAKQRRLLERGRRFTVRVRVTYTQRGGKRVTKNLRVTL